MENNTAAQPIKVKMLCPEYTVCLTASRGSTTVVLTDKTKQTPMERDGYAELEKQLRSAEIVDSIEALTEFQ